MIRRALAVAGLTATIAVLTVTGTALPAPPPDPAAWLDWWATDPALAFGALLRLGALVVSAYLLAVTALDAVAAAIGAQPLVRLVRRLAPAAWRTVVLRPLAVGSLAMPGMFAPMVLAAPALAESGSIEVADDADAPVLTMAWLGSVDGTSVTAPPIGDGYETERATLELVATPNPSPDPTTSVDTVRPAIDPNDLADHMIDEPLDPSPPGTTQGAVHSRHHVVAPGDSFWRIAEQVTTDDLGRRPTVREVGHYWRVLVDANQDRLAVSGNPDLIFPGDVLVLPPRA